MDSLFQEYWIPYKTAASPHRWEEVSRPPYPDYEFSSRVFKVGDITFRNEKLTSLVLWLFKIQKKIPTFSSLRWWKAIAIFSLTSFSVILFLSSFYIWGLIPCYCLHLSNTPILIVFNLNNHKFSPLPLSPIQQYNPYMQIYKSTNVFQIHPLLLLFDFYTRTKKYTIFLSTKYLILLQKTWI